MESTDMDDLPGYDAWKLRSPDEFTPEQERAFEQEQQDAADNLREAIAATLADYRGSIYLADVRKIVIEELNKLTRQAGEPEWQTRTPVPLKFDEQAFALREAYVVLAFCFNRLHGSARARDGELCASIGKVRGKIEGAMGIPALSRS
jgi:hypothetical protein